MRRVTIGRYSVDESSEPYLIAEIGVNHEGSLQQAKRLIELAHEGGAHAAKFQTYKAEKLASRNSPAYWDTTKEQARSQYELFKRLDTFGADEFRELARHCARVGIDFLSTPFDTDAVEFLAPLVPCFKVASADVTNVPLLRAVARQGKPVVLSTGASTLGEIDAALDTLHRAGAEHVVLLHCILNYPTRAEDARLGMIAGLLRAYPDHVIGYSDHTLPDSDMLALTLAYVSGARVIEKHFTHDKTLPGNDHYHAMDVDDLRRFVVQLRRVRMLEGPSQNKEPIPSEQISRLNARRSIVLVRDLPAGASLTEEVLTTKRPGTGISPVHWDDVVGRPLVRDLDADHVLQWEDLAPPPGQRSERVIAVVQARMGSARFPGKMMARLAGKPLIEWVLGRVKQAKLVHEVVLATSRSGRDDVLDDVARQLGVLTIRGDEQDVLSRFVTVAEERSADWVVRICGDNPFVDPSEIDRLVDFALVRRPDYAFNHLDRLSNGYPDGFGAEIFTGSMLREMNRRGLEPDQREHVTRYVWDHPHAYRILTLTVPREIAFADLRFDVDTPADLERIEPLAIAVGMKGSAAEFVAAARRGR